MGYYTTIVTINKGGKPVKVAVSCGGKDRGYTNENTGKVTFELASKDNYDVYIKRFGEQISGKVKGGSEAVLRFKK